jgi:signal transduction histidine kinase
MYAGSDLERRVLILAPTGRDALLLSRSLTSANIRIEICPDLKHLQETLEHGAAALLLAEEALYWQEVNTLGEWLTNQPPWSDLPIIIITSRGRGSAATADKAQKLQALGNVTFVERPARPETIEAAVRGALRARSRQYEMRRRQETLTRVNADLEQFAYTASHDLQEPIRNITIYSDLLSRRYGELLDARGREFLAFVHEGGLRMDMLVRDLLAYTKAASIADEEPEAVQAEKPLKAALLNLSESIRQSHAQLTYSDLPEVKMREVHLQQLFQNLIGNGIKYRGKEDPQIHISAEKSEGRCLFRVKDNGIGISPEYKERIFGLFKRLHNNDEHTGTGIGLAICQRIVDRYRGKIWVDSELGKGSTFTFAVPG